MFDKKLFFSFNQGAQGGSTGFNPSILNAYTNNAITFGRYIDRKSVV